MSRLTFHQIEHEARKRGLILEQVSRTIDGQTTRYEVTENAPTGSVTAECQTLEEAWSEIYYWKEGRK